MLNLVSGFVINYAVVVCIDAVDACPVKRKSAAGDAPDGTPAEGASPEKKAKLEDKAEATTDSNGEEAKAEA